MPGSWPDGDGGDADDRDDASAGQPVHPDDRLVSPASVARWHDRGYAINTWTVDEPARLRALAEMGVDGVCCNDPAAAVRALGR